MTLPSRFQFNTVVTGDRIGPFNFELRNSEGGQLDLTDRTASFRLRDTRQTDPVLTLTSPDDITLTEGTVAVLAFSAPTRPGVYHCELVLDGAAENSQESWLTGVLEVVDAGA